MNKTSPVQSRFTALLFSACMCAGLLLLSSCGLDEYYILEAPSVTDNISTYDKEYLYRYVEFFTNESGNSDYYPSKKASFVFLGTEIYYKIYNNYSTLSTQKSAISSVNTTSNYSAAATKIIETYTYQTLGTKPATGWSPFIECAEQNRKVYIRLNSYGTGSYYEYSGTYYVLNASVAINGTYYGQTDTYSVSNNVWTNSSGTVVSYDDIKSDFVVPGRILKKNGYSLTFDFFDNNNDDDNTYDIEPVKGDSDYCYTDSSSTSTGFEDDTYYVQLYAVAVGRDANYTNSYSLVLDLGTIPVKKE